MRLFWPNDNYRAALRAKYRFYQSRGVGLFDRTTFVWGGNHRHAPGWAGRLTRGRELALDRLRNRQRLSAYRSDTDTLRRHLAALARFRPVMLYGFSNAIYLLAREAQSSGFVCPSLRLVVMTSEVATPAMQRTVQAAFDAPVAVEYGAMECPLIAGQRADGAWELREDLVRVETVATADGRYEVVLTVLANHGFPLLRYAIEDVTDAPLERPAQGFSTLPPVGGRCDDVLITGEGQAVHATAIDAVFEEDPSVRRYRVHQRADGSLLAMVQPDATLAPQRLASFRRDLEMAVPGRQVSVEQVAEIPLTRGGKQRAVISDLAVVDVPLPPRSLAP